MQKLLTAASERVRETLADRRRQLEAVAQELLRHEVVDRAALTAMLSAASDAPHTPAKPLVDVDSAA